MRLVTITGPGGAGKSRLALEVAARAALDRPVHLVGLAPGPGRRARPERDRPCDRRTRVERAQRDRVGGRRPQRIRCAAVPRQPRAPPPRGRPCRGAPRSRTGPSDPRDEPHSAPPVDGARPPTRARSTIDDATTLFVELAAARGVNLRDDALASVHEICRRLDGLPLAIELVAARLAVLPPAEILRALGEGLALEMEGPVDLPERQRTLRAAIDWSYQTADHELSESSTEPSLSSPTAARSTMSRAVAAAGGSFLADLEALVGWSLVRSESTDGDVRLSMLETVREHALGHLSADGALDELRMRHAMRFLELALEAESELAGPDQSAWFGRLERELDNIGGALDWLLAVGRVEDALQGVSALERFWRGHAHVAEARRWLSLALAGADDVEPSVRAAALRTASLQAAAQSDWTAAESMLAEAASAVSRRGRAPEEVIRARLSQLLRHTAKRHRARRAVLRKKRSRSLRELGRRPGRIRRVERSRRGLLGARRARARGSAVRGGGQAPHPARRPASSSPMRSTPSAWRPSMRRDSRRARHDWDEPSSRRASSARQRTWLQRSSCSRCSTSRTETQLNAATVRVRASTSTRTSKTTAHAPVASSILAAASADRRAVRAGCSLDRGGGDDFAVRMRRTSSRCRCSNAAFPSSRPGSAATTSRRSSRRVVRPD